MRTVKVAVPWVLLLCFCVQVNFGKECPQSKRLSTSKLVCYYGSLEEIDGCYCSNVILPANSDVKGIEKVKEKVKGVKIYVTVNEFNQGLIDLLKSTKIDGLELNLKKLDSKNDISDFISTVKSKIGSDLDIALSVPAKAELVAKYFDFKALSKHADLFILETAFLGASTNVTFHPSRLSGMWDIQNTDSVVDLVSGLGAPLSKVVVAAPVQAFQFTLQNSEYSAPGSPALELESITRNELCRLMKGSKNWTMERDEDQAGPYIFSKNQWIAFEDSKSIDIKAKYSRVRGLAGLALKDLSQDGDGCGSTILEAAFNGLSRQARAPRGAVLHSLEREIADDASKSLDSVQLSPFRISRIIDTEGKIHVTRQDSRTEFQCSRQGYFVHPRSCNRFYRCVKFDQTSDDYNVFEFDCPAGLAFDERVEVCVWPGSLPHGTPCSGSSEIAPVPKARFECPSEPGYYPDPENCRWFFACLDHGKSPLSAYEFRCPYGLVFDEERLVCEWPWLVARCASGVGLDSEYHYGGFSAGQGYALRGPQSTGVILENYNGLGQLGTVKLGGVAGKFAKPVATVYSNVGSGSLGLGYQNSNGYIEGGGLSYKAALALQNAGLLKVNNGAGYQANGQQATIYSTAGQGAQYSGQSQGAVLINTGDNYAYSDGSGSAQGNLHLVQSNVASGYGSQHASGSQGAAVSYQSASGYNAYQDNNLNLAQNNLATGNIDLVQNNVASGYGGSQYASGTQGAAVSYQSASGYNAYNNVNLAQNNLAADNVHLVQNNVASGYGGSQYASGAQGAAINYQTASGYGNNYQDNLAQTNLLATGHGSSQILVQGGGASTGYDSTRTSGFDYVASGENAFGNKLEVNYQGSGQGGAVSSQSITQYHGEGGVSGASADAGSINIIGGGYSAVGSLSGVDVSNNGETHIYSTGSPAIISTTAAPATKVVSVPTVVSVPVPGIKTVTGFDTLKGGVIANIPELQYKVKTHDIGLFKNLSNSYANFVVTPTVATQNEYLQTYSQSNDFGNKLTLSTATPFVTVTTARPQTYVSSTIQPIVNVQHSSASFQKYDSNGGYNYEKPSVVFEEKPQVVVTTARPVVVKQQPQIIVSSTPAPAVSTYSYTQESGQGGYVYEKPTIISKFSIRKPAVQKTVIEDYTYQQPSVTLYQQPQLLKTYTYQKQPVSTYNYKNVALQAVGVHQQPQVQTYGIQQQEGYVYDRPSIKFEETPVVYSTAKPVNSYVKFGQENSGYVYNKPAVAVVDVQPVVPVVQHRPAVVTSYFNLESGKSQSSSEQSTGYVYNKPSIEFNEVPVTYSTAKPVVAVQPALVQTNPAVVSSYFNLENSHAKSEHESNSGYVYNKPAVEFHETPVTYSTPKPIVQPQPAVVTSYFNLENSHAKSESSSHQSEGGYVYDKPAVEFHETPVTYSTPKPVVAVQPVIQTQPAVVTSYFNLENSRAKSEHEASSGYVYNKPSVEFRETPVTYSTPKPLVQPAVVTSYYNLENTKSESNSHQSSGGYVYNKPSVEFHEAPVTYSTPKPVIAVQPVIQTQPAVVSSYFNLENSHAKSESSSHESSSGGYVYNKPSVEFHETPVTYSTPKPIAIQPVLQPQPAVVTSYFNLENSHTKSESNSHQSSSGYVYNKPSIEFHETPVTYSTPKPIAIQPVPQPEYEEVKQVVFGEKLYQQQEQVQYHEPQDTPVTYSTAKPLVAVQPVVPLAQPQPAVVTSYFNLENSHTKSESNSHQSSSGYVYNKPSIEFHETPVTYSTPKPISIQPQPAVVTSYFNLENSHAKSESNSHETNGYVNTQPAVQQVDTSAIPAVVNTYFNSQSNEGYAYPKPAVKFEEKPLVISTPKPFEPSVGYTYPKPAVKFEETPQPAVVTSYFNIGAKQEQPEVYVSSPKPAVVSSYSYVAPCTPRTVIKENVGYTYPKPSVSFVEEPQLAKEEPFVKKTAYVTGQNVQDNYDYRQGGQVVENYQFPEYEKVKQVVFGQKVYQQQEQVQYQEPQLVLNYVQSTPKPTFVSTIRTIARQKIQPVTPATVTFYDSRYTSTPATYSSTYAPQIRLSTTSRPISHFEFSSENQQYQYRDIVKSTTAQPVRTYLPVTSTVKYTSALPTKGRVVEEYIAPEITTLARDYLPVRIRTKAPSREYLPVEVTTPSREYLPVRVSTKAPSREYLPVEVSTEGRRRIKVTSTTAAPEITTLDREYLPVRARVRITTTASPIEDQTYTVRPRVRPAAIQVARPVTVIKQNDAHPLLSAKLGAQCTCVSNSLKLRKNQKIIIVEDEENGDDDGYVVDNGEGGIVENYEAQRVVDIRPSTEVYLKSTTGRPVEVRNRVKVRPVSKTYLPVTEVSEVFIRKNVSPAIIDDDSPSDREIAKAVRTGFKLVKQAAKEGAKEGTEEVLSQSLDRYGSGGIRSRTETLQGSVDCQRAGLFRHPTECNKFYACRWDCTKKRFTLHVFNCPVHLTFDNNLGACNWPSQGPACVENTLITSD